MPRINWSRRTRLARVADIIIGIPLMLAFAGYFLYVIYVVWFAR